MRTLQRQMSSSQFASFPWETHLFHVLGWASALRIHLMFEKTCCERVDSRWEASPEKPTIPRPTFSPLIFDLTKNV